jgi:S-DNA-T family DNA segregation ATPase FtsK/SpoIIIE
MLRKDELIMYILTEIVAIGQNKGSLLFCLCRPNAQVLDTTIRANLTVSMGFKLRDKVESRIVNIPGADELENISRLIMNSDQLYEIQAPYAEMEDAKDLLTCLWLQRKQKLWKNRQT